MKILTFAKDASKQFFKPLLLEKNEYLVSNSV